MSRNPLRTGRSRKVFLEANGDGPWPCHYCDELVVKIGVKTWDGNIHHLDEDVTNDDPSNLVMAHVICHQHQHPVSEAMKAQISAKLKGRPSPTKGMKFSSETNAKKGKSGPRGPRDSVRYRKPVDTSGERNSFFGRTHTPEAKAKMSAFQKARPRKPFTPEHRVNISRVLKGVPKSDEHRANIAIAARTRPRTTCDRCGGSYTGQWIRRHKCVS